MLRLFFVVSVVLFALNGCSSSISPVKPPKSLSRVENQFSIRKVWDYKIDEGASDNYLRLTPVLNGDVLYSVDYKGTVTAFRTTDQSILWEKNIGFAIGSPLTLSGNFLYLGTSDGQVLALDKDSGEIKWQVNVSSEVLAAPAVDQGFIIVRCVNGEIFALKSEDGKKIWSDRQITPSLTLRGTSAPVIYNDLVFSAFDNGKLIAYNLQTGRILWETNIAVARGRTTLERLVDIDAGIVISDDIVYTVAFQGRLAAVSVGSGQILWSRELDSYIGMSIDPYRIYLVDSNSELWALDKSSGATLWKQDALLRRSVTRPILQANYVILGDFDGFLHWFKRDTGKLVARVRMAAADYTDPNLDEREDLLYPKMRDILATPVPRKNELIVVDRHGNSEAFEISYP